MDSSLFVPDEWSRLFIPDTPILEIIVRGSIIYLSLFFALRLILKREAAGLGISDLLVVVLLADAVQNGMGGEYTSVADALVLALTIIGWDWFLSYLAFRFRSLRVVIRPRPIVLIQHGRLLEENLKREFLTIEELVGELRQQGIERIEDVDRAYMESNGTITAIPKDKAGEPKAGKVAIH